MNQKIDALKTYMSTQDFEVTQKQLALQASSDKPIKILGRNHFSWWLAIKKIESEYNSIFHAQLIELSSSWVTCACGNQCSVIPRYKKGEPRDTHLSQQGYNFFLAIQTQDWAWAKACLYLIEVRAIELIKEVEERNRP
ncbi:hypothetical protein [Flavobacterium sp.]|jgi:hypothetical protein|uniref:hypothetical protein n=1 Tax=Flavobacterium sp. TaxID=239 RepID=UPI0037C1550E